MKKFTSVQRKYIEAWIIRGFENKSILHSLREKFPEEEFCSTREEKILFGKRMSSYRHKLYSSEEYLHALKAAHTGYSKKETRINERKRWASDIIQKLSKYEDKEDLDDNYFKLQSLLLDSFKGIAVELGEWKTTKFSLNLLDQRKQIFFDGTAIVPAIESDKEQGFRIVAPAVKQLAEAQERCLIDDEKQKIVAQDGCIEAKTGNK